MFEKILAPLDGSRLAEAVVSYAVCLHRRLDSQVIFLHVCRESSQTSTFLCKSYVEHVAEIFQRMSGAANKQVAAVVESGPPAECIVEQVDEGRCDSILMAVSSQKLAGARLLGSTVHKVLTTSRVPVMVVQHDLAPDDVEIWPRNVLVPVGESDATRAALPYAEALARRGSSVTLVRVCEPPVLLADYPESEMHESWEEHVRLSEQAATNACAAYAQELEASIAGQEVIKTQALLAGSVAEGLIEAARRDPLSLVVMPMHRKGRLEWPYGHTADRLLRGATNPMLLIEPE